MCASATAGTELLCSPGHCPVTVPWLPSEPTFKDRRKPVKLKRKSDKQPRPDIRQ